MNSKCSSTVGTNAANESEISAPPTANYNTPYSLTGDKGARVAVPGSTRTGGLAPTIGASQGIGGPAGGATAVLPLRCSRSSPTTGWGARERADLARRTRVGALVAAGRECGSVSSRAPTSISFSCSGSNLLNLRDISAKMALRVAPNGVGEGPSTRQGFPTEV